MEVTFEGRSAFPLEQIERNEAHSAALGLPAVETLKTGPLAIVGGGASIHQYRYTLQSWPGSIWAINRTWRWCRDNGIDATFFTFDPNPTLAEMAEGAERAILGNKVDPSVFDRLKGREIWLGRGSSGGTTSAGQAIIAGLAGGSPKITLFGCEGCHQPGATHAYGHWEPEDQMVVWCGEMHFLTSPQMFMASVELSTMIKSAPNVLKELSGGLLRAMIENATYEVVGYSQGLEDKIKAA